MKPSTLFVFVVVTLLKLLNTEAHFKQKHGDSSLSSPIGFQSISGLPTLGQSSDLKTTLAIQKTVGFMTLLMSKPKLLCFVPPFLIIDFLTQLSCNPAILNAIPHNLVTGFMSSLSTVPTLVNAIPPNLFVSISNTLSIGTPDAGTAGAVGSPNTEILPAQLPSSSVSANNAAALTPIAPSPVAPTPNLPGVYVTQEAVASISPAASPSGPVPSLPGVSVTQEAVASISPAASPSGPVPSLPSVSVMKEVSATVSPISPPGPVPSLPGVTVMKEVSATVSPVSPPGPVPSLPSVSVMKEFSASISPLPTAPVLPADLPTTDGATPNTYPPAGPLVPAVPAVPAVPSVPCIGVPAVGSPPIPSLPIQSLSPLSFLSSLFSKGTGNGNSLLESKIESIVKLLAGVNLKLPQLDVPKVGSAVSTKPLVHVKPETSKVFILLPAPMINKPEIPSAPPTKLYYKPGSLNQILDFFHQRLLAPPQKLTIPKPNISKINLPKINSVVPVQSNPIKCLPIFSKSPC